jgi:hypothetical protein
MDGGAKADRDRLSLLLGGAALGLTLSKVVQLPTQQFGLEVLGSPLGVQLSTSWLLTLFVVGLVIAGTQSLLEGHPLATGRARMAAHWILPAMTSLMAGALLAGIEEPLIWMATMVALVALLGVVVVNEYHSLDPAAAGRMGRRVLVAAVSYSLALGFLSLVYGARLRTLVAGPVVWLVCGLLAVRLLWGAADRPGQVGLYGAVIGLVMAQCVWIVGYWSIRPLAAGTILLLCFYVLTGVVQAAWEGRLGRRALVDYGLTAMLAVVVVLILGPG